MHVNRWVQRVSWKTRTWRVSSSRPQAFFDATQNVVLIGGLATTKTLLSTAIGIEAIQRHNRQVRFIDTIDTIDSRTQLSSSRDSQWHRFSEGP